VTKTIVIGAGGGGIASALLARFRGEEVTLLESHENIGGCASWFHRGDFCFDVGATTVSGLSLHEPLGKLFSMLKSRPQLKRQDPGIVFHLSSGKKLSYFCDFEKWMEELEREFPQLNHRPFWKKVYSINSNAWRLLENLNSFPFKNLFELMEIFKAPDLFHLYPYLLVSTEMMLKFYGLHHPDYLELVNGILLISAQAHAENIPFLVGAMALAYPRDTYAPRGGMKGFMSFLEEKCIEQKITILKDSRVFKIEEKSVHFLDQQLNFDQIILNVPYWNIENLFTSHDQKVLQQELSESKHAWGAFTLYFGVKSDVQELYQQVHLNHPDVPNYFVSFSNPQDLDRAPSGWQAVTISTHVEVSDWFGMKKDEYKAKKNELMLVILNDFKRRFNLNEMKFMSAGTPKTFERFTGRKLGYVGGLPFLYGMNPFSIQGHSTKIRNIYRVGDTTFPGQGLVGVVAGALALDHKLRARF
jgi:C-3',4' desaturase CrtD